MGPESQIRADLLAALEKLEAVHGAFELMLRDTRDRRKRAGLAANVGRIAAAKASVGRALDSVVEAQTKVKQ